MLPVASTLFVAGVDGTLVAAYTRHIAALSWVHEGFSRQQTAPPACRILVLVEPPLYVLDCLFVGESP